MTSADDNESLERAGQSPWMCHVCNTSSRGEGQTCSICFRTTCPDHLRRRSILNSDTGLYEFTSICVYCIAEEMLA